MTTGSMSPAGPSIVVTALALFIVTRGDGLRKVGQLVLSRGAAIAARQPSGVLRKAMNETRPTRVTRAAPA